MNFRSLISALRELNHHLIGYRGYILALAATSSLAALMEAVVLALVIVTASSIAGGGQFDASQLALFESIHFDPRYLPSAAALAIFIRFAAMFAGVWLNAVVTSNFEARRRSRLLTLFLQANWAFQAKEKGGRIQSLFTENINQGVRVLSSANAAVTSTANFIVLMSAALFIRPYAVVCIAILAAALLALCRPVYKHSRRRAKMKVEALTKMATAVHQTTLFGREVRVFNVIEVFRQRLLGIIDSVRRNRVAETLSTGALPAVYQSAVLLTIVAGLALLRNSDAGDIDSLGTAVLLLVRAMGYSQAFQTVYHHIVDNIPYLEQLEEYERECLGAAVPRDGEPLERIDSLACEHCEFSYLPGRPVLSDISFSVRRGECIGIVGPSGSGKSTLIQLLLRLREPQVGDLLVNGHSADRFSLASWYDRVSFVPQEPVLLRESISENISFLRPGVAQDRVEAAARDAGILDEILAMPLGFDTPAGERGNSLSGGQRQRVCIARALAGDPDVIVFDEPTSALDAHSEARVLQTLNALKGRVTVFIIAHRLSTLNNCDKVMVLCEGRLQDFDSPRALAAKNDYYTESLRMARIESA